MSGLLPALGGGANSVVQLAAGGLSGVLGMSALIASGVVGASPPPAAPQTLALVGCPGAGSVVAVAKPGDQLWVTGRSVDGAWLRVYVPGPAGNDGWAPATTLNLLADGSAVPVAGCAQVAAATATPGPTAVPATATATPTATDAPTATPTSRPTATPTPAPTPSPTPNVGPRFTSQPSSSVATINTNPLGSGTCTRPLAASLRTTASDPDGVAAVQLWVRKPGAGTYQRGRDFTKDGSRWTNVISTKSEGLTTAGSLSWYAIAIDATGKLTKSVVRSLKIVRCDTEATIAGGIGLSTYYLDQNVYTISYSWGSPVSVPWSFTISDPDGVEKASVSYTLKDDTGAIFLTGTTQLSLSGGAWTGHSASFDGNTYSYQINTVTWTLTSTDALGGTSKMSKANGLLIRLP